MNKETGHNVPVELISKSLSGEASPEELQFLDKWLHEDTDNRKIFEQYIKLWEKTGDVKQIEAIDLDEEWEKFSRATAINKPVRKINGKKLAIRLVAAVFAGAILGYSGLFIYKSTLYEKITADAEVRNVVLPDRSSVTMNAGSQIRYHKHYGKEERNIKLKGEAYFDVVRDTLKPFSVEAGDITVKVLGTSFNVDAASNKNLVTVVVAEGKVALYGKSGSDLSAELVRGQKAVADTKTGTISKGLNENPNFDSYKTRRIVFNNTGLEQVAGTLCKVYNVNIEFESLQVYDKRITVTFDNKDLDYVLKTIEATLDLEIERTGSDIIIK